MFIAKKKIVFLQRQKKSLQPIQTQPPPPPPYIMVRPCMTPERLNDVTVFSVKARPGSGVTMEVSTKT